MTTSEPTKNPPAQEAISHPKIGSGSYGHIYSLGNGLVKKTTPLFEQGDINGATLRETCFLATYEHSFIRGIERVELTDGVVNMIMRDRGCDLNHWTKATRYVNRMSALPTILTQLVQALAYLENLGILHGDLKPANILINKQTLTICIIDWGSTIFVPDFIDTCRCSYAYAAPELLSKKSRVTASSDIWSLGMIVRNIIYKSNESPNYINRVCNTRDYFPLVDSNTLVPSAITGLIKQCQNMLMVNPTLRPTAKEILTWPELKPYIQKNLVNLKHVPESVCINWDRFQSLKIGSRKDVINLLWNMATLYNIYKVLPLAVHLMDRFIAEVADDKFNSEDYILLGIACFNIAVSLLWSDLCLYVLNKVGPKHFKEEKLRDTIIRVVVGLRFKLWNHSFIFNSPKKVQFERLFNLLIDENNIGISEKELEARYLDDTK